ncbi:hypothetical protein RA29_05575 [Tateyamaria sp. ANG-S1]|nr:hypothetical protein RA29_05575 [Tateyamaria sp. ANG-S1]
MADQFGSRTDRARNKVTAAIRTRVLQLRFSAIGTESAFEAADAGILCLRWQIRVAALAIGF